MTATRKLRAVAPKAPALIPVTLDRAAIAYPDSAEMQRKWLAAVHWMQSRPSGSIWLLDTNRAPAKWRSLPGAA
jgi:hypothetical protein